MQIHSSLTVLAVAQNERFGCTEHSLHIHQGGVGIQVHPLHLTAVRLQLSRGGDDDVLELVLRLEIVEPCTQCLLTQISICQP